MRVVESLRRHICERADLRACHRQPGIALRLSNAEVDEISEVGQCHDDVLRLDISVDQALIMSGIESVRDLLNDRDRAFWLQWAPVWIRSCSVWP